MNTTPRIRRTVVVLAAAILLALVGVTARRYHVARAADEAGDVRQRLAGLEKPAIPEHENAAAWLQAAAAGLLLSPADREALAPGTNLSPGAWTAEIRAGCEALLERYDPALSLARRAVALPRSSYGIAYSDGLLVDIPNFLKVLDLSRLEMVETRSALLDGDAGRVLSGLEVGTRIATTFRDESTLITALLSVAAERMVLRTAGEVVATGDVWASDPAVLERLEAIVAPAPPGADRSWAEHPEVVDALARLGAGDGALVALLRVLEAWSWAVTLAMQSGYAELVVPAPQELEWLDQMREGRHLVPGIRSRVVDLMFVRYGDEPTRFDAAGDEQADAALNVLEVDGKGFRRAIARTQLAEAQRRLVLTAIALRRLGISSGAYPAQRPDLDLLAEPDPFTGRPLRYEVSPDGFATVSLDGATELAEQIVLKSAAEVPPITLPPPR